MADTAVKLPANADWYTRNYPDHSSWVADCDPRCWEVLATLGQIYNVLDRSMPDGGLRPCGHGLSVLSRSEVSSFDGSEMTALVVAAHRLHVRVAVQAAVLFGVRENPKDYDSDWQRVLDSGEVDWDGDGFARLDHNDFATTSCGICELTLVRQEGSPGWFHDDYVSLVRNNDDFGTETELFGHTAMPEDLIVETIDGRLRIIVDPREPSAEGVSSMVTHPGMDRLARMAERQAEAAGRG